MAIRLFANRFRSKNIHVGVVQARALALLTETTAFDLESLRDSIRTNGYIPVEQIVVESYEEGEHAVRRSSGFA